MPWPTATFPHPERASKAGCGALNRAAPLSCTTGCWKQDAVTGPRLEVGPPSAGRAGGWAGRNDIWEDFVPASALGTCQRCTVLVGAGAGAQSPRSREGSEAAPAASQNCPISGAYLSEEAVGAPAEAGGSHPQFLACLMTQASARCRGPSSVGTCQGTLSCAGLLMHMRLSPLPVSAEGCPGSWLCVPPQGHVRRRAAGLCPCPLRGRLPRAQLWHQLWGLWALPLRDCRNPTPGPSLIRATGLTGS